MRRCGRAAFDGKRVWTCLLYGGHEGDCWASFSNAERPFWEPEEWLQPIAEEPIFELVEEPAVATIPKKRSTLIVPREGFAKVATDGVRRKEKYVDSVYAGMNDYVKTAVSWDGHAVRPHPSLSQYESDEGVW